MVIRILLDHCIEQGGLLLAECKIQGQTADCRSRFLRNQFHVHPEKTIELSADTGFNRKSVCRRRSLQFDFFLVRRNHAQGAGIELFPIQHKQNRTCQKRRPRGKNLFRQPGSAEHILAVPAGEYSAGGIPWRRGPRKRRRCRRSCPAAAPRFGALRNCKRMGYRMIQFAVIFQYRNLERIVSGRQGVHRKCKVIFRTLRSQNPVDDLFTVSVFNTGFHPVKFSVRRNLFHGKTELHCTFSRIETAHNVARRDFRFIRGHDPALLVSPVSGKHIGIGKHNMIEHKLINQGIVLRGFPLFRAQSSRTEFQKRRSGADKFFLSLADSVDIKLHGPAAPGRNDKMPFTGPPLPNRRGYGCPDLFSSGFFLRTEEKIQFGIPCNLIYKQIRIRSIRTEKNMEITVVSLPVFRADPEYDAALFRSNEVMIGIFNMIIFPFFIACTDQCPCAVDTIFQISREIFIKYLRGVFSGNISGFAHSTEILIKRSMECCRGNRMQR